ncbi:RsmB/NOP family class I SAM-dependent RNA methyltransferase [Sphingomonas ginkgonis]|uniref:RsmB/NOP family class I SAM-dependent RNA methyltransferase n=1 Tax=Sphingomonas ginkgonis TaxID=2315330 RepID=A0A3R9WSL8_9SPHN|nr:RsmB/NOP family class I SAM-dependent RNA methyltransferase [Sphingomonas ginkgonis]RST30798.1 RsmB/NOP family class I SAM-dependent RNA methyltransferase [Sphingomonas ginkgonis]
MTPQARAQAAIDILDQVIASAREDGPPADGLVQAYFRTRRYAGSKDRRAVRELVFRAIRASAEMPAHGRQALLAVEDARPLFDGSPHAPTPPAEGEAGVSGDSVAVPGWLVPELSPLVGAEEWASLVERAPLDLRVNVAQATRGELADEFAEAVPTSLSPWGLRLPPDQRVSDHPAFADGRVEVQDEGSQLVALACLPAAGQRIVDLCAGAGGKALALSAATGNEAELIACDTSRDRLSRLGPRAERAGARISTLLLDGGREAEQLAPLAASADVVLVDAPCSGSGTWRRNPEGRWRLTPERLERLTALQRHVLELAVPLVRPGGALVYAVCSLLAREGEEQAAAFLSRHSAWQAQDDVMSAGRSAGPGRLLTPAHDGCDGFFVARFTAPC